MIKILGLLNHLKYMRRFILAEGFLEYLWFLRTQPKFYENFHHVVSGDKYPSESLKNMSVSKALPMYKWSHYFDIYAMYLSKYRNQLQDSPLRVLEIGVADGGSLLFWQEFFGTHALILGIDIDPKCLKLPVDNCSVRIGSQSDGKFLLDSIKEFGGVDVVIDDGSHINADVISSFKNLFPVMNDGGTYLIEDVSTSYWPGVYKGGWNRRGTTVTFFKSLADYTNGAYFKKSPKKFGFDVRMIESIHFHNSIIVVRKKNFQDVEIWSNRN